MALQSVLTPTPSGSWLDRDWDTFRCRKCQRLLFKFDDGQSRRIGAISTVMGTLEQAAREGRITADERSAIEATFKQDRVIEIKCTLSACKTMNYLMESVR